MKKSSYFLLMLTIFLYTGLNSFSQYIKLNGNQFFNENGQPVFPMVMNYEVEFAYQGSSPDIAYTYINRASQYGKNGDFTGLITEGNSKILQDFYEIKNLGFNTVRLIMKPQKRNLGLGLRIAVENFPDGQNKQYIDITPNGINNSYIPTTNPVNPLQFYFTNLTNVINLANQAGLMVICPTIQDSKEMISGNVDSDNQIDNRAFFSALASYINAQQIHNILAYEFIGEPTYAVNTEKKYRWYL